MSVYSELVRLGMARPEAHDLSEAVRLRQAATAEEPLVQARREIVALRAAVFRWQLVAFGLGVAVAVEILVRLVG